MIRTRDFLLFTGAFVFLLTAITATVVTDSLSGGNSQVANVSVGFAAPVDITEAESPKEPDTRAGTINRLKNKISAGEGDVSAGEPVFTSVDTVVATDTPTTDQFDSGSILIGQTMDGGPLMSDDLWRFVGFAQTEQIGVALNGFPIFGSRVDSFVLDPCGGIDERMGYRYYFTPSEPIDPSCYAR